jgi:hypothetical protein
MFILNSDAHPDIIAWLPHGRGFIISDKKRLETDILPKYFKVSKFTSFTRRLNRWEFTIHTMGHKKSSYFHPKFMRHDPRQCLEMVPAPQPKKKQSAAAIKKDRQKEKTTASETTDKSDADNSELPTIQPNKKFSSKNMPSLPSAAGRYGTKGDHTNQQLLYSLSNVHPGAGVHLYNPHGIDPNMMTMENAYFPNAGMNAFPYSSQMQQPFMSLPQQGYFPGHASQGVVYQGSPQHQQQQHIPSAHILVPVQQDVRYMQQYAPYAPLAGAPGVQQSHLVGTANMGSPHSATR